MNFELDEGERSRADAWTKQHLAEHHGGKMPRAGAIGGNFVYTIVSTSLGRILGLECGSCYSKLLSIEVHRVLHKKGETYRTTLTDFEDW